ncbi:hypothetical protein [Gaoshiqia sp. Z1-71]|uniref:hypothetical protein n=1 Tax=Gaoshiqia hydrogeniformans TaxID=3290090 RepID=UPI003BF7EB56
MKTKTLVQALVELALSAQEKQTKEALEQLNKLSETPETIELKKRLAASDQKINQQCRTIIKADRIFQKLNNNL